MRPNDPAYNIEDCRICEYQQKFRFPIECTFFSIVVAVAGEWQKANAHLGLREPAQFAKTFIEDPNKILHFSHVSTAVPL